MKIKKISKIFIVSLFTLIVCSIQVYATIDMNMNVKSEFFIDEIISFNYSLVSDVGENITYIPGVSCPNTPTAMLDIKIAALTSELPLYEDYAYLKITEETESQQCTAYVVILEPINKTISKNFTVNTNPSFNFNLALDKKVFASGENINIDYTSTVDNPLIEATLIYPDKSARQISLPYSFTARQVGTYKLNIIASKVGYKTVSLNEQFGVIKENANIEYTNFEETGNAVDDNEGSTGRKNEDSVAKVIKYVIYVLIGIAFLIIVSELIKKIRYREKPN